MMRGVQTPHAIMRFALAFLLCVASVSAHSNELLDRLKSEPNMVVLMRHAHSGGGRPLAWDETGGCSGEMRITEKGREQARRIGEAFAARGIRPALISSPMCRCLDTARAAFGGDPATHPELREIASADDSRARAFENAAKSMLLAKRGPAPVVFVSHQPNIDHLTMELVAEGELLVGRIGGNGEVEVLGRLTPAQYRAQPGEPPQTAR